MDEVGNAERLVDYFGEHLRFCPQWKSWLIWDGMRWQRDLMNFVYEFARRAMDVILDEIKSCVDEKARDQLARHASRSRRHNAIRDVIAQASTMQSIVVRADELDTDPYLFNVRNGTIDLRTGRLREHRREDLITKLSPVEHDPLAAAPLWKKTLGEIFADNAKTIAFLQRWAGYALSELLSDHVVVIAYGSGRNGKSTVIEILHEVMGDYSTVTAFGTFVEARNRDDTGPRPDIVRLRGARLISTTEGTFGSYLDESTIKRLSGGDRIYARGMREAGDEFTVVGKCILQTNHRPLVRGADLAIKSRLRLLPFPVSFAGREDPTLADKLCGELPGILNWLIRGYRVFAETKAVGTCPAVEAATRGFFSDMDLIQEFLDEWVVADAGGETLFEDLYRAYEEHCRATGTKPLSGRRFGEALTEKGIAADKRGGRAVRGDVRLAKPIGRQGELPA
jgi:putative DNA primase/helicase